MNDMQVMEWFFSREALIAGHNWPLAAMPLVGAKRLLDTTIAAKMPAADVKAAYERFGAVVGPTVMTAMLTSDDAFPEVNHSDKPTPPARGAVTLYVDPDGNRVLAAVSLEWGMPPRYSVA